MLARRLSPAELMGLDADELAGAVLLAPLRLDDRTLAKGTRIDAALAGALRAAAARLDAPVRLAWPDPGDLHEDEAAAELARAVGGAGVQAGAPKQSRIDLRASWDGVLHVEVAGLAALNAIDPVEVFTLFHGQSVIAGQTVASVKVAPHLVAGETIRLGVHLARERGPLVEVRPYRPVDVGAIVAEPMQAEAFARFENAAARRITALCSRFVGTVRLPDGPPDAVESAACTALETMVVERGVSLVLVGGVSAGDPLAPFVAALDRVGGRMRRHGVPAHPGSMIWLAEWRDAQILGLPQCGMFSMATAADLILPRLLTGERLDAAALADLGHGGLLGREMRFRFPAYARELAAPDG